MPNKSFLQLALGALALCLAAACAPIVGGLPQTVHPSPGGAHSSVGVSGGALITTDEGDGPDTSALLLPYSEGWARFGVGSGELEVHLTPGLGGVGYRFDITSSEASFGFALQPMGVVGLVNTWDEDLTGNTDSDGALAIGGGVNAILQFRSGSSQFYLVPRLGFTHVLALGADGGADDSDDLFAFGLVGGIDLGTISGSMGMSLELSIQRVELLQDGDDPALWLFVPSVAFHM